MKKKIAVLFRLLALQGRDFTVTAAPVLGSRRFFVGVF